MRGELRSLTAMRGIAAWLVVIYHVRSGANWAPEWLMAVAHKGYLAVDFFFLLSGFVIYLSAHHGLLRDGPAAIPAFLARRFARIYPLYGTMLAFTVLFAALLVQTGRPTDGYPWDELPLHIIMVQNWGFTPLLSWNHPAWSISAEFAAYLLFPLLVLFTPVARANRGQLLIAMACLIAMLAAILQLWGQVNLGGDVPRFGLIRCLMEFSCGAILCAFWLRGPDADGRSFLMAMAATLAFWGLWLAGIANETWAFPAGAACLIVSLAHASGFRRNPLHWRGFLFLGEISYATYLCHFMLFVWFKIAFVDDARAIPPILFGCFLAFTLAASFLLHHLIERPGRQWVRAFSPRRPAGAVSRQL